MDAIKGTTKFKWGYPAQQNPRRFKLIIEGIE